MLSEFKRSRWKGRVEGVSFVSSVIDFSLLSSLTGLVLSSSYSLSLSSSASNSTTEFLDYVTEALKKKLAAKGIQAGKL